MLKLIITFCVEPSTIPTVADWTEAVNIAKENNCVVELKWMPNILTGWYHDYVFGYEDPVELDAKIPKVYGV